MSLVGFSAGPGSGIVEHKERSDKQAIRVSRIVMMGTGVVALITTFLFPPSLFWVTYFIGTVLASHRPGGRSAS